MNEEPKPARSTLEKVVIQNGLLFPLVQQAIMFLLAGLTLDGGQFGQITIYAAAAYWVAVVITKLRRKAELTKGDRLFIRWGFLMLCLISLLLTTAIWHWRGYY